MRELAVTLAALAGLALATYGYSENGVWSFYAGCTLAAAALGLAPGIRALRFGSVYLATLLVVDGAWHLLDAVRPEPGTAAVYSYADAQEDPAGFRRWWEQRMPRWLGISPEFTMPDPRGRNPYVLTPGTEITRRGSLVRINALGFRGAPIQREKGELFRIVAIGESTTFGLTLRPDDRSWPLLLQERIGKEYACDAPVQVVNAGVPGWTLANQNLRLAHDILPLEPDLILSYHGYNGFHFFLRELPSVRVLAPPEIAERPSRIAGELERVSRWWWFRRRYQEARETDAELRDVPLLANPYAEHYRRLVAAGRAAGSEVALATFNMAVNSESPEEAVRFYEAVVPDVRARIVANQIHNEIVRAVGEAMNVSVLEATKRLDGAYGDAYIDIAHFTQLGRELLTENLLRGLDPLLAEHPRLRCRHLGGSDAVVMGDRPDS